MLQAFEGIIDATGLRSLRQDSNCRRVSSCNESDAVPFWAVLESKVATQIIREILSGNRLRALRLLESSAVSLGSEVGKSFPAGQHQ